MDKIVDANGKVPVKRIGILIQCRENSSRFPGKWKADLLGDPVILHVLTRCNIARLGIRHPNLSCILGVVIPEKDSELEDWLIKTKVEYFKGPEEDVLSRYIQAREHWKLDWVVRVTADCPMIDPNIVGATIMLGLTNKLDYLSNCGVIKDGKLHRSAIDGNDCQFMSRYALEWLDTNEKEREHPGKILLDPEARERFAKDLNLGDIPDNMDLSHIKTSIDTIEDLERVRNEYKRIREISEAFKIDSPGSIH